MAGLLALSIGACGEEVKTISKEEGSTAAATAAAQTQTQTAAAAGTAAEEPAAEGYYFEASGIRLYPDMDVDTVLASLGECTHYEEESCAAQGMAHFYTFADYEINTYPDGNINRIYYILLKTDNVATAEGVDLSMDKEKVISVYGEDYTEDGRKLYYEKGGMRLSFIFNADDTLASIEYDSIVLEN